MNFRSKIIDFLIFLCTVLFYLFFYKDFFDSVFSDFLAVIIGLVTVFFVNFIKLLRIYIILYGKELSGRDICFLYARTAVVNSVIPYKLGEFYRIFLLGKKIGNLQEGIIIIILDRLMDTLGLLMVMVFGIFLTDSEAALYPVVLILIIFVICMIIIYRIFPGISGFWKKYLLRNRSSKRKLWGLEVINRLQHIYTSVAKIVDGRGVILLVASVFAWLIEISLISVTNKFSVEQVGLIDVSEYLNSILCGNILLENARYTILSVTLLSFVCAICLLLRNHGRGEKECEY